MNLKVKNLIVIKNGVQAPQMPKFVAMINGLDRTGISNFTDLVRNPAGMGLTTQQFIALITNPAFDGARFAAILNSRGYTGARGNLMPLITTIIANPAQLTILQLDKWLGC